MKRSVWFLTVTLIATAGLAAKIDMNDPRRAVGTDDNVRIDAELTTEVVSADSPIGVTVRIQNRSPHAVAVADRLCDASYDSESRTITLSVGSEIPAGGELPRLVTIPSGEYKTFTAGARVNLHGSAQAVRRLAPPAFVQITVNVLRDATPFAALDAGIALSDEQFDQWLRANNSIVLNALPVRYRAAQPSRVRDASQR